jgi:uncharacterized protein YjeT (DUF2065 family)
MHDFLTALGLALAIEGLFYAASPAGMKRLAASIAALGDPLLRGAGLALAIAGLVVIWLVRGWHIL